MTQTNRVQIALVRETTPGTTPNSPRMRKVRFTGEGLTFTPTYVNSDEIRSDRMMPDPILVMQNAGGPINFELNYPDDNSPLSEILRSAFFNTWANTPTRFNDGTAASQITGVVAASHTMNVASGAAFAIGHLVRTTGFGVAANNGINRVTTGGTTSFVASAATYADEASPAAAAKAKVVGFQGTSGDITATASGLASTTLDFTTLQLGVGQWIKVGGTATSDKFASVAANNDFARVAGIAANALTLDNLPAGWGVDAGTGKTIKVWFGDTIKNGTTQTAVSIEKAFLGQGVPNYIVERGMTADQFQLQLVSKKQITGSVSFMGMGGSLSQTALSGSPDAVTTGRIIAANANVGRIAEAGALLASPNWANALDFTIANNLREIEDIGSISPVAVREGACMITGKLSAYFGDSTLLTKLYNNTPSSISTRVQKDNQALVWQFPRVTYTKGDPQAAGANQDVIVPLEWTASIDTVTNAHVLLDRLEYYEA